MKPNSPRAKRRHAKWRKVERAKKIFPNDPRACKLADNMKYCTHVFCKNKRKLEGPTRREIKQLLKDED